MNTVAQWHIESHQKLIHGRYISASHIDDLIHTLGPLFTVEIAGHSVEQRPIYTIQCGQGTHKILMWSQMHGNESTTTKAVFDLFKAIADPNAPAIFKRILKECTLCILPQLNPDGATAYTRVNAANVDLNRDAQQLSQPESRTLRSVFNAFAPDVCFNLHGQRTIYGFKATATSSVMSFLAPAGDEARSIPLSRKRAMSLITYIHNDLSGDLNHQIGRYDDGFNIQCTGDTFMAEGVSTVLFEAGHHPEDYTREKVRHYIFKALIAGITGVIDKVSFPSSDYFHIPEHQKCYCDILITNTKNGKISILFEERLKEQTIVFVPIIDQIGEGECLLGHRTIDANGQNFTHIDGDILKIGDIVSKISREDGFTITLS